MANFTLPCACVILFLILWRAGYLSRPHLIGGCVLIGVAGEILAPTYSTIWLVAVLLNIGVALYLAILLKMS